MGVSKRLVYRLVVSTFEGVPGGNQIRPLVTLRGCMFVGCNERGAKFVRMRRCGVDKLFMA